LPKKGFISPDLSHQEIVCILVEALCGYWNSSSVFTGEFIPSYSGFLGSWRQQDVFILEMFIPLHLLLKEMRWLLWKCWLTWGC